jgi:hypothetical protein
MSNTATVGFEMAPDRHAVHKAMAEAQAKSLSEMVRESVEWAQGLERQAHLPREFSARSGRDAEG